ncbi:MAG: hypothetical protein Q4F84_02765, partial [Fibrobacter sp.]|nr:hypothetical protein [Fibrobacter sp.]
MKKLHLFCLFVMVWFTLSMAAESYEISGVVKKKGGGPIGDVTVLLKSNGHSAVTNADGEFILKSTDVIKTNAAKAQPFSFRLSGNTVKFVSSEKITNGNLSVFTGNGKRVASVDFSGQNAASGQLTLPQLASGLNTIR